MKIIQEYIDEIIELKKQRRNLRSALKIAKNRILELHGEHDRNYSYETLNKIDAALTEKEVKK